MLKKRSWLERLTGTINVDSNDDGFEEHSVPIHSESSEEMLGDEEEQMGQLGVDVYETANAIIIKTMIAGVKLEDVDISLNREMITISGHRKEEKNVQHEDYHHQELYWGSFSRTISLPTEVNIDKAEATESHGLLTVKLPKTDKERQAKLTVKSKS